MSVLIVIKDKKGPCNVFFKKSLESMAVLPYTILITQKSFHMKFSSIPNIRITHYDSFP